MTKNIFARFLSIMLVSILACVGGAFAQSGGTGSISVTVTDSTGAIVKGAALTLTNKATNQSQSATTGDDGLHTFVLLRPGSYTLKTTASSFGDSTLEIEVQVGRTTDANVSLAVGNVSAVVQVTAEGIQTTTSNFDAVQDSDAIQNLPINGRRFQDLVAGTPSALVSDTTRGQISLAGQRGINSNVNVDGVDFNQPFFGGIRGGERSNSAFTLPQESIQEFQVVASGYSAEYGRSSGGIVNAVTKSGGNDFRGSAFLLWRPEDLALGNEFTDALREQKLNALNIPLIIAPTQTQFGGSVGGPIVKEKLFFFTAYEQQELSVRRAVAQTTLVNFVPTVAQTEPFNTYKAEQTGYDQTNDARAFLGKVDWDINGANRFNVRYNYSKNEALNGVSTGDTSLDPTTNRSLGTNGIENDKNNVIVAQLISSFSSRLINEARFQWAKEERPRLANVQQVSVVSNIGELGTRTFLPTVQDDKRYQIMDSMTFTTGSHTLKFGGEYSKIKVTQAFGFNQFGNYTFSGLSGTGDILNALSATPGTTAGKLGRFDVSQARFNQQIGNLQAAFDVQELSFFGQDSWKATQRLTINFGLRYEKQFNPSAEANNTPVIDAIKAASFPLLGGRSVDPTQIPDSKHQWGPRLGFAYDLTGDGKTVIRAYSGIYYARTPAIVLAAPYNNFRNPAGDLSVQLGPGAFNSSTFSQANFDAANPQYVAIVGSGQAPNTVYRQMAILGINLNTLSLSNLPSLSPTQLQTIADRIQAARTGPASALGFFQNTNVIGISPDFQNPVSYQLGTGFERELWSDFIFGMDFAWVKTVHLQRNVDINLPAPSSFDLVGRPIYNRANRPVSTLGTIQLRDSTANSLYRAVTWRARINKKWGQINAFYTWSKNESDDDNERDSGGVLYDDPFSRRGEYYASRLDRTHVFTATPSFYLPGGFTVSSGIRLRSGSPLNAVIGASSDLNGDNNGSNERPYFAPGVEMPRNYLRNRSIYEVDLRAQKSIGLGETTKLIFSGEIFNVFALSNLQLAQSTSSGSPTLYCAVANNRCGLDGATNVNFLQTRDQRPGANFGKVNLLNTPGSQPFQVQIGARLTF
ncbi:MAG: TonB-dependent receptor [Chloracidobacterium sp.]|nr:TonB-dependent receptor [Chloracidobacterium sp.]